MKVLFRQNNILDIILFFYSGVQHICLENVTSLRSLNVFEWRGEQYKLGLIGYSHRG